MDFIAWNYPVQPTEEEKKTVKTFFHTIAQLLPCASCRDDFSKLLKSYPIDTVNRDSLTRWLVEAHNRVNERLGKPRLSYEVVANKYEQLRGTCEMRQPVVTQSPGSCPTNKTVKGAVVVILLILITTVVSLLVWWGLKQGKQKVHLQ